MNMIRGVPMPDTSSRPFEPGTTGWTAADLDDPAMEAQWAAGSYEIVEGVLTRMPPAYFTGGYSLYKLMRNVDAYLEQEGISAGFGTGVEIILDQARLSRADAALLTAEDEIRHAKAARAAGRKSPERTRILVPPTLIIESVSPGHELHDERTKKRWYAEFGVPNYWLLDALKRSLQCFRLEGTEYHLDVAGRNDDEIRPSAFPGLVIPLARLWKQWRSWI
jgi:Uma2 family endonuclease